MMTRLLWTISPRPGFILPLASCPSLLTLDKVLLLTLSFSAEFCVLLEGLFPLPCAEDNTPFHSYVLYYFLKDSPLLRPLNEASYRQKRWCGTRVRAVVGLVTGGVWLQPIMSPPHRRS
ncbi:hypothetical protein BX600DRAFT_454182 [Xylariales sp. PMI_506]|nr:hypothetical protein BX600DRAFT_454182 [Xylariales sp. PMI_506]